MENLRVLAIFIKHYNKWFCIKEDKIEWHPKYGKGKYRVLAKKIAGLEQFRDVYIRKDKIGYKAKDVVGMKYLGYIMDVHGVLK